MKSKRLVVPMAALAIGLGSVSTVAAQSAGERHHNRGQRSERADRGGDNGGSRARSDGGARRERGSAQSAQSGERRGGGDSGRERSGGSSIWGRGDRSSQQAERRDDGARAEAVERGDRGRGSYERSDRSRGSSNDNDRRYDGNRSRSYGNDSRRYDNDRNRYGRDDRGRYDNDRNRYGRNDGGRYDNDRYRGSRGGNWYLNYRGNWGRGNSGFSFGYYAPRRVYRSYAPRRYYGSGGYLSLHFWSGSGYRYGSPYYGRVYGYRRAVPTYGDYVSYGDVKLKIKPSDAAVYVDGYYAGVVDSFDGLFQELTLEVGPHEIEVVAPGGASEVFDVYVDPYNTIDLHADLRRD